MGTKRGLFSVKLRIEEADFRCCVIVGTAPDLYLGGPMFGSWLSHVTEVSLDIP
jgi:hypothetical protein